LRELVARQRLAWVAHQRLQHRELAGRQRDLLAVLRQASQGQVEFERSERHRLRVEGRSAGRLERRATAQHAWMRASSSRGLNGFGR
jgi:hypothetical protein